MRLRGSCSTCVKQQLRLLQQHNSCSTTSSSRRGGEGGLRGSSSTRTTGNCCSRCHWSAASLQQHVSTFSLSAAAAAAGIDMPWAASAAVGENSSSSRTWMRSCCRCLPVTHSSSRIPCCPALTSSSSCCSSTTSTVASSNNMASSSSSSIASRSSSSNITRRRRRSSSSIASSSFPEALCFSVGAAAESCCIHAAAYHCPRRGICHQQQQEQLPEPPQQQQQQHQEQQQQEEEPQKKKDEEEEECGVKESRAGRGKEEEDEEKQQQQQQQHWQEELLLHLKDRSSFGFVYPPTSSSNRGGDVHALPAAYISARHHASLRAASSGLLPSSWGVRTPECAVGRQLLLPLTGGRGGGGARNASVAAASEKEKNATTAAAETPPAAAATAAASASEREVRTPSSACQGEAAAGAAAAEEKEEEEEEETEEEKKLLWRTTKKRLIDFRLDAASRARLQLIHNAVMESPPLRNGVSREELLLHVTFPPSQKQQGIIAAAQEKLIAVFFPLDTLKRRARHLLATLLPTYENSQYLYTYFSIQKDDVSNQLYFLLLHIWLLHRRFISLGEEGMKTELWDALWDFYRALLTRENVSEMRLNSFVKEMQSTTTGFCLSLDEAMDEKAAAGEVAHRIWFVLFRADEKQRYSPAVLNLTAYLFRTAHFVAALPPEVLLRGSFTWPRWPPPLLPLSRNQNGFFDKRM